MLEPQPTSAERVSSAVREGLAHHRAGRLTEAAEAYQQALRADAKDADALVLLGLLARKAGRAEDAVRLTALAAKLRPDHAGIGVVLARAERSLGHWLCGQQRFQEAIAAYRAGLRITPHDATLHYALGAALAAGGRRREAKAAYREALRLRPVFPEVLLNLGNVHYDEGAFAAAAVCCRKAVAQRPAYAKAWCNLGNALQMLGGLREATGCYDRTLAMDPTIVAAQHNLGNAWMARRDFARAEESFRRALSMDEQRAEHHNSLGNALFQQRRDAEAEACYRRALERAPGYAAAHTNLANALMRRGNHDEMIRHYERALELDPKSAGGHYNLALAHLREGRYDEGWQHHESRWDFRELKLRRRRFAQPQWKGETLRGETILLHAEQGLGDTLQFVRYALLVAERGGNVVLEVQPRLQRLLRDLPGVNRVIARGETLPDFAWHCPLMSLPLAFATTVDTIPRQIPYVRPDAKEVAAERRRWPHNGLRVGICWAGNPQYRSDEQRSMPLRTLLPLVDVPGIAWFSLQMGPACGQMPGLREKFPLVDASSGARDFTETAALVATLALVISVDTSVAHLAGAMGRPVWVVLPHSSDWRWMEEREDSPWYPTARLFRQRTSGDWGKPVERMQTELRRAVEEKTSAHRASETRDRTAMRLPDFCPHAEHIPNHAVPDYERVTGCGTGMGPG
jgi:tetratricopeptide (TPR) repeat protein